MRSVGEHLRIDIERFIGILIEHHAGKMPAWLAPIQVAVLNITDAQAGPVQKVQKSLEMKGLRVISDLRNEKIGFKIREHTLRRIPYLLIIGEREAENETVAVRTRGGKDLGALSVEAFSERLLNEIATHGKKTLED